MTTFGTATFGSGTFGNPSGVSGGVTRRTPDLFLEVAFDSDPFDASPVWEDVTSRLRAFSCSRGRQFELDRFQAGRAQFLLDNRDRALDPMYDSSPYAGGILPTRKIRLSAEWNGTLHRVFTGFVDGWPQHWVPPHEASTNVPATDGFKLMALAKLTTALAEQAVDARVAAVLDAIGWPTADRFLLGGTETIAATTLQNASALDHLQAVTVDAEAGRFFIDGSGRAVFHGREIPYLPIFVPSLVTFGDNPLDPNQLPYSDIVPLYDDNRLWNDVRLTRQGGTEQVASDSTSQDHHRIRTLEKSGLLLSTDASALSLAQYRLAIYKDPILRIESLMLQPGRSPNTMWPHVLGREIGDRVAVGRRPQGIGAPIAADCWIEGVSHQWNASTNDWRTVFSLSRADAQQFWILGDAEFGLLGQTTYLSF